jgi:hypothetical protein
MTLIAAFGIATMIALAMLNLFTELAIARKRRNNLERHAFLYAIPPQAGQLRRSIPQIGGERRPQVPVRRKGCQHKRREPVTLFTGETVAWVCICCLERVTRGGELYDERVHAEAGVEW